MKHLFSILLAFFPLVLFAQSDLLTAENGDKYMAGIINLKIEDDYRSACTETSVNIPEMIAAFEKLEFIQVKKKFPTAKAPETAFNAQGFKMADISLIYELYVAEDVDVLLAAKELAKLEWVVYAEPQFVSFDQYVPNDSHLNNVMPYHYDNTSLYAAWDTTMGDTNVVIGITETAINVNHPEFVNNIKYNYDDPAGNGDDDNDSYEDNFAGWDMVDNDNDLFINNEIHGDAVSAIASASADNNLGYAGAGFKCKFLPVKVGDNSQSITHGYQGIQYCVEQGCSIVNCSWGNTSFSQVAQDVVTWAAINNDVVIVASAGNANATDMYYPASYNYVLSVTGVDANDQFNNGVNTPLTHNDSVDVSAPGINVYTTATFNGQYLYSPPQGGTSMAAPIVSGIAGLVRSQFPCLTALEVIEQIKATTDNIDGISQNVPYAGLIGTGRVNAQMAVSGDLCTLVGIGQKQKEASLVVYPNPTTNATNVRMEVASNWTLRVMDSKGRLVMETFFNSDRTTISGLTPGIYTVDVSDDESSFWNRLAIIR